MLDGLKFWRRADDDVEARALTRVNEIRETRLGLEPLSRLPAGIPADPWNCSLARALPSPGRTSVAGLIALRWPSGVFYVPLDDDLYEFIQRHDRRGRVRE